MKCYIVRKDKYKYLRDELIKENVEFLEEFSDFKVLIIPLSEGHDFSKDSIKEYEIMGEEKVRDINFDGYTFKIESTKGIIEEFAKEYIKKGKKVDLENPDKIIEIKKWNNKYLVNVS